MIVIPLNANFTIQFMMVSQILSVTVLKFSSDSLYLGAACNGEEDVEISCKDDTSTNYDHINRSVKVSKWFI